MFFECEEFMTINRTSSSYAVSALAPQISIPRDLVVVSKWSALGLILSLLVTMAFYLAPDGANYWDSETAVLAASP
jgi:hypothetical protein